MAITLFGKSAVAQPGKGPLHRPTNRQCDPACLTCRSSPGRKVPVAIGTLPSCDAPRFPAYSRFRKESAADRDGGGAENRSSPIAIANGASADAQWKQCRTDVDSDTVRRQEGKTISVAVFRTRLPFAGQLPLGSASPGVDDCCSGCIAHRRGKHEFRDFAGESCWSPLWDSDPSW